MEDRGMPQETPQAARYITRRSFLSTLAGLSGAALLAACSNIVPADQGADTNAPAQNGQALVTIELWDQQTGTSEEAMKQIIADFESKNPTIKINRSYIPPPTEPSLTKSL